jgi:Secretion system C-terminal sorting domain/Bacterial Ig domain
MSPKSYIKLFYTALILLASLATGLSQGVVYKNRNVFVGQLQNFTSAGVQSVTIMKAPKRGLLTIIPGGVAYQSISTSACLDTFSYAISVNIGGLKYTEYLNYALEVDFAFLDIQADYAFTNKNQPITVDVLANDATLTQSGSTSLTLAKFPLYNNAEAPINVSDKLKFTPAKDFVGLAYVNYVACYSSSSNNTSYEKCKSGTLTVQVNDVPAATTTSASVSTSKGTPLVVLTPRDGFQAASPSNGTVAAVGNNAFRYTPDANFTGQDQIVFTNAALNLTHTVNVTVINKTTANQFAVDDIFYTAKNTTVTFDVVKNDRVIGPSVPSFSYPTNYGTLLSIGNGKFSFTPNQGFEGIAKFTYNLKNTGGVPSNNNVDEWATVNIVVSDQKPGKQIFELKTPINTPLVLNYNIPILGWNFSVLDSTQHGALEYRPGATTLNVSGQSAVSGYNLMIYTPTTGFVGTEDFELIYTIGGRHYYVKISVLVEPVTPTLPQYCVGDCVWAGDSNNDGIVDIIDILPVGYCQGQNGFGRPNSSTGWYGQFANNWQQPLMPGINMKYIDTDGDGDITGEDITPIDLHYNKTHNITPERVKNYKAIPYALQLLTPNPQIGDLVEVDVLVGTSGRPATDLQGFTMDLKLDSKAINFASAKLDFYPTSWLTYNSPSLHLAKKHSGEMLDFGMVRTGGTAASGMGRVAKLSFIIDDDIHGFRDADGNYQASLALSGGKTMGSDGLVYDIEPMNFPIPINLKKGRTGFDATKVITYPNPTSSELNIYVNGGYEMSSYQVYNLAGQQLISNNAQGKTAQINTNNLTSGIYFVKIISDGGVVTKKFEVVK